MKCQDSVDVWLCTTAFHSHVEPQSKVVSDKNTTQRTTPCSVLLFKNAISGLAGIYVGFTLSYQFVCVCVSVWVFALRLQTKKMQYTYLDADSRLIDPSSCWAADVDTVIEPDSESSPSAALRSAWPLTSTCQYKSRKTCRERKLLSKKSIHSNQLILAQFTYVYKTLLLFLSRLLIHSSLINGNKRSNLTTREASCTLWWVSEKR